MMAVFQKKVKLVQDPSYSALQNEVNDCLKDLAMNGVDDTNIRLHLSCDPNQNTVMIEWFEAMDEGD